MECLVLCQCLGLIQRRRAVRPSCDMEAGAGFSMAMGQYYVHLRSWSEYVYNEYERQRNECQHWI